MHREERKKAHHPAVFEPITSLSQGVRSTAVLQPPVFTNLDLQAQAGLHQIGSSYFDRRRESRIRPFRESCQQRFENFLTSIKWGDE